MSQSEYETIIAEAITYIRTLFENNADGHDVDHSLRVYRNARLLAQEEDCDPLIVALAALLHDADDHKLFQTVDHANARSFLKEHGLAPDTIEKIIRVIDGVSFSKNHGRHPDDIETMIVQDADRLDAIGAIGIARTFAYGGCHQRSLDDSIQHFHDKLLLLQDELNTEKARDIARTRHSFMLEFLKEYAAELNNG